MQCLAAITRLQLTESLGHMPLPAAALPSKHLDVEPGLEFLWRGHQQLGLVINDVGHSIGQAAVHASVSTGGGGQSHERAACPAHVCMIAGTLTPSPVGKRNVLALLEHGDGAGLVHASQSRSARCPSRHTTNDHNFAWLCSAGHRCHNQLSGQRAEHGSKWRDAVVEQR